MIWSSPPSLVIKTGLVPSGITINNIDKIATQVLPLTVVDVDINLYIVDVDINQHSAFLRKVYDRHFISQ